MYQPTVHRVLHTGGGGEGPAATGQSRISVPFFYEPNFDAVVAPLSKFCGGAGRGGGGEGDDEGREGCGARFTPIMYGEHLTRKVYSNFETEDVTLTYVPHTGTTLEVEEIKRF
jgi:hypothetical protein